MLMKVVPEVDQVRGRMVEKMFLEVERRICGFWGSSIGKGVQNQA